MTIRDRDGEVFAAITCAGVVRRMSQARMEGMAEELRAAALTIERALGRE